MAKKKSTDEVSKKKNKSRSKTLASRALKLLDALEAELKNAVTDEWESVFARFESILQSALSSRRLASESGDAKSDIADDPEFKLEVHYQELQSSLIQVRRAVATAIASEKQLEQQLQNSRERAQTWLDRAAVALGQGSQELAMQATQRRNQYIEASEALELQLTAQQEMTAKLRQQLTDLESMVQKAYTTKQILIARSKSASAALVANECFKNFNIENFASAIQQAETTIVELEERVKETRQNSDIIEPAASAISLAKVTTSVELLLEAVTTLSQQLASIRAVDHDQE